MDGDCRKCRIRVRWAPSPPKRYLEPGKDVNCWGILINVYFNHPACSSFHTIISILVPHIQKLQHFSLIFFKRNKRILQRDFLEAHQANPYQINSSLWSLLLGALQFHTLSLPSSSFQPAPPWPGSLLNTSWTLPFPSFLAAALSDLSLPLTPSTTCCLTRYPAGFSGEIPFFLKGWRDWEVGYLTWYADRCFTLSDNV